MATQATQKELFMLALTLRGWKVQPTTRTYRSYVTLVHPDKTKKLFVGTHGSLRVGRIYSECVPVSDKWREKLKLEAVAARHGAFQRQMHQQAGLRAKVEG